MHKSHHTDTQESGDREHMGEMEDEGSEQKVITIHKRKLDPGRAVDTMRCNVQFCNQLDTTTGRHWHYRSCHNYMSYPWNVLLLTDMYQNKCTGCHRVS